MPTKASKAGDDRDHFQSSLSDSANKHVTNILVRKTTYPAKRRGTSEQGLGYLNGICRCITTTTHQHDGGKRQRCFGAFKSGSQDQFMAHDRSGTGAKHGQSPSLVLGKGGIQRAGNLCNATTLRRELRNRAQFSRAPGSPPFCSGVVCHFFASSLCASLVLGAPHHCRCPRRQNPLCYPRTS